MNARLSPFEALSLRGVRTNEPEARAGQARRIRPFRHYTVAGIVLRTELEFPGLPEGPPTPVGWSLRIGDDKPPFVELTPIGERALGQERYSLGSTPWGYRLEYSHAGWFDISVEDATVTWYRNGDARLELVRAIVLGPIMALALERNGLLCLHGSCVVMGGKAIAFLGGKHHGKSTLALALVRAGARWVSDDLIAIAPGSRGQPATVRPGIASARLWNDAAAELEVWGLGVQVKPGIKSTLTDFSPETLWVGNAPLGAIYLLEPEPSGAEHACSREPLHGAKALITLAHQTKLADELIGLRAAGAQLRLASEIASTTPVWTLHIARDFTRLPAVLEQITQWHS
jgi:hypothetical protein